MPPGYLRTHGLQEGDRVLWIPQDDGGVLLRPITAAHPAIHDLEAVA